MYYYFILEFDPKMIADYLEKSPGYGSKAYQCKVCGKVRSDKSSASKNVENIHKPGVFTKKLFYRAN